MTVETTSVTGRAWGGVKRYALASLLRGSPAEGQSSQDGKSALRHAFSARGLVESGLPSVVFVAAFRFMGTRPAAAIALAVAALMVVERLARKKRWQEAVSGIFGVVLAVALSAGTGEAKNFFLPEVVIGFAFSLALGISLFMGKPLLGVVLGAVASPFKGWQERPVLKRAFVHITAVAGIWAAIKASILFSLYLADDVELLAAAKLALGYPALAVLLLYYFRVVKKALVREAASVLEAVPA
jgi:intracellular septation protein A